MAAATFDREFLLDNEIIAHARLHETRMRRGDQLHETRAEAAETIRALVDQVTLVPENGELAIVLKSDLAVMLSFAVDKKKPGIDLKAGHSGDSGSPVSVVAGIGFEPMTFRL